MHTSLTTSDRLEAAKVAVLMYHRVGLIAHPAEAKYCVTPALFEAHLRRLAENGHRAVPIARLMSWMEGGSPLAAGDFVLTFDDGYADLYRYAFPILQELDWPFAVFIVTGLVGERDAWARSDGAPCARHSLLERREILAMGAHGGSFHSHGQTHRSLIDLDDEALALELTGSLRALRDFTVDTEPVYFAYPFGHVDDRVEAATKSAGYAGGFSVQTGFNNRNVNRFRLRRIDVLGTDSPQALLRKLSLGTNDGSVCGTFAYYAGRVTSRLRRAVRALTP